MLLHQSTIFLDANKLFSSNVRYSQKSKSFYSTIKYKSLYLNIIIRMLYYQLEKPSQSRSIFLIDMFHEYLL